MSWSQPQRLKVSWQDHRHPVVDGTERLVGRRGNDGAGADDLALRVPPRIPIDPRRRTEMALNIGSDAPFETLTLPEPEPAEQTPPHR